MEFAVFRISNKGKEKYPASEKSGINIKEKNGTVKKGCEGRRE